jgi:hypothetical protein
MGRRLTLPLSVVSPSHVKPSCSEVKGAAQCRILAGEHSTPPGGNRLTMTDNAVDRCCYHQLIFKDTPTRGAVLRSRSSGAHVAQRDQLGEQIGSISGYHSDASSKGLALSQSERSPLSVSQESGNLSTSRLSRQSFRRVRNSLLDHSCVSAKLALQIGSLEQFGSLEQSGSQSGRLT